METKVYVELQDPLTVKMFNEEDGFVVTEKLNEADLICFIGGADVTPALYQDVNKGSHCTDERDMISVALALYGQNHHIPMCGICRGGQFLNVWNGGRMVQDISGHNQSHNVVVEGFAYLVTSSHHQEMIPPDTALVVGYSEKGDTVEIVSQESGDFCFQPHPEWVGKGSECRNLFFKLLKEYCLDGG